jgi:antirestriction protein ArdC
MKRDLYAEVTDQIVSALETGTAPWIKPWTSRAAGLPCNAVTGRPYRGINVLLLSMASAAAGYPTDEWCTFKQALDAGTPVRKGEKATRIYFFKKLEIRGDAQPEGGEEAGAKVIPMLREYCVFNVAQLSGELPGATKPEPKPFAGDAAVDAFIEATGARFVPGGDRAFYSPAHDVIGMPAREAFRSAPDYYATKLHELTHWTGHASRCDRLQKNARFGDQAYAFEELIAEMGAAFLCAGLGIEGKLQHANYIASWIKVLKEDKRAIFRASSMAQKACDFLEGLAGELEDGEEVAQHAA